jgi:hypothetical protein
MYKLKQIKINLDLFNNFYAELKITGFLAFDHRPIGPESQNSIVMSPRSNIDVSLRAAKYIIRYISFILLHANLPKTHINRFNNQPTVIDR